MSNFYESFLKTSPLFTSTSRVSSVDYLETVLRGLVEQILQESADAGMPLMVFETYRSPQRQHMLYLQKATQLSQVGVHHYGLACDIVKSIDGQPSWKGDFTFLGALANKHGLVWGGSGNGNLNIGDNDHVQRCKVLDQGKLFAGTFYPDEDYVSRAIT